MSIKDSPGKGTAIIIYNIAPNLRDIQGSDHKEFLKEPKSIKLPSGSTPPREVQQHRNQQKNRSHQRHCKDRERLWTTRTRYAKDNNGSTTTKPRASKQALCVPIEDSPGKEQQKEKESNIVAPNHRDIQGSDHKEF